MLRQTPRSKFSYLKIISCLIEHLIIFKYVICAITIYFRLRLSDSSSTDYFVEPKCSKRKPSFFSVTTCIGCMATLTGCFYQHMSFVVRRLYTPNDLLYMQSSNKTSSFSGVNQATIIQSVPCILLIIQWQ